MQKIFFRRLKGFTLIELLIVIAIIGILAVALLPRIAGAPGRARDAQRKANLQSVAQALEAYGADHGGLYPTIAGGGHECLDPTVSGGTTASSSLNPYMRGGLPKDPNSTLGIGDCSGQYEYYVNAASAAYLLRAQLETTTDPQGPLFCVGDKAVDASFTCNNL